MSLFKRRLRSGVTLLVSLIAAALLLHLALEWRQALNDINAMIVTPIALPEATDSDAVGDDPAQTAGAPVGDATATLDVAAAPTSAPAAARQTDTAARSTQANASTRPLNILLLGTDARPGDPVTRTDAVILVHLDRQQHHASMLSIPRDLWVTYPGAGKGRINAAYAVGEKKFGRGGGAALAKKTVGNLLDVEVDYFAMVNFEGFSGLIDELDGITIDVPEAIHDPAYPTEDYNTISVRFRSGTQRMSGDRALIYARTRHADSDFGRNQRQQLVLMAIFDRVREQGLLQQITRVDDYTRSMRDYIRTDMSRQTMFDLARWGHNLDYNDIRRYAIDATIVVDLEQPATFAADPTALQRVVKQFVGGRSPSAGGR